MEPDALSEKMRQWALLKAQADTVSARMNKLRDELMDVTLRDGDRDEKGNTFFSMPFPIEVSGKTFTGIKREARTSTVLDEERALEFAKQNGLQDIIVMVESIDLDALMAAHQQRRLTTDQLDGLFETKTSYAFKPVSS